MSVQFPYQDKKLTIRERTNDLCERLTVKEKVGQLNQHLYGWKCYQRKDNHFELTDYFKKHVKWGGGIGALYGVLRADPWSQVDYKNGIPAGKSKQVINQIQRFVIKNSRLGIPALIVEECPHGLQGLDSVSYPTNIGKGNAFDIELISEMAHQQAFEMKNKGVNLALVSTLDLAKDPRWGRFEECFGEDPFLSARYTEAIISGFQGNLIQGTNDFRNLTVNELEDNNSVGVVIKHLIGQGETLGGHNSGTVTIGNREFMDIYYDLMNSSRDAVGVMAAYNDIDGVPCHANRYLLAELLRKKIGFQGIVMADGVALDKLSELYPSKLSAAVAALSAGVDLSLWDDTYTELEAAIEQIPEAIDYLNTSVKRVLSIKFLLRLFDRDYDDDEQIVINDKSDVCNLELARKSITMVKNNGILPLTNIEKRVFVIGPNANNLYNQLGDYTSPQTEIRLKKTIFTELQRKFPNSKFFKGSEIRTASSDESLESVISSAKKFNPNVIVSCLGGSSTRNFTTKFLANGAAQAPDKNMDSGENIDLASLKVGGNQLPLLREIKKLNKPMITVMIQGRPYELTEIERLSDALLIGWYPGQQGGQALAEIITGEINPSGRLSISYPRNSAQLPVYYNQRDVMKNDDYFDLSGSPQYKFGYGLHYGKITYSNLVGNYSQQKNKIFLEVTLDNSGKYEIEETVLVFAKFKTVGVLPRTSSLVAFKKVKIKSGMKKRVNIQISVTDLHYTNSDYLTVQPKSITLTIENQSVGLNLE